MSRTFVKGPRDAKIVAVGEALGPDELSQGKPFVGPSGWELDKMLVEGGVSPNDIYFTNVLHEAAPFQNFFSKKEGLQRGLEFVEGRWPHEKITVARECIRNELRELKPNIILALGDIPMWAITGESGITKWRGSVMESDFGKVLPTFNPAGVMKNWPWRWLSVQDFRRLRREADHPEIRKSPWNFLIRPTFDEAMQSISSLRGKLVVGDIEGWGELACVGFATDELNAFCIPFRSLERPKGYWSAEEELEIVLLLRDVLTDPSTKCIFQNGLYDMQVFAKQLGFVFNLAHDTMIMFHVCYPGLEKNLALQSSLFCDYHKYWKDDNKTWQDRGDEEQQWSYCCEDCVRTFECFHALSEALDSYKLRPQYEEQMRLVPPVFDMMLHGVRTNREAKRRLGGELLRAHQQRATWLETVLGHPFNPRSHPQMKKLFYEDFAMRVIKHRKTREPTLDDDALELIVRRQPVLRPLVECIQEMRSIGVFKSNFVDAKVDDDDHMRCSVNITGTNTFRFSMSINAFGGGCNMQTIPKGTED